MVRTRALGLAVLLAMLAPTAAACGGGEDGVAVEGAWARPSPQMANAGAVYMELTSSGADRLVGASVDPAVAAVVEVHETVMAEGTEEAEEGMGAMMMQEVGEIALPAGDTVSLEPGGLHIMLLDLAAPLAAGDSFDVTLQFATAGEVTVEVEVRDEAP